MIPTRATGNARSTASCLGPLHLSWAWQWRWKGWINGFRESHLLQGLLRSQTSQTQQDAQVLGDSAPWSLLVRHTGPELVYFMIGGGMSAKLLQYNHWHHSSLHAQPLFGWIWSQWSTLAYCCKPNLHHELASVMWCADILEVLNMAALKYFLHPKSF